MVKKNNKSSNSLWPQTKATAFFGAQFRQLSKDFERMLSNTWFEVEMGTWKGIFTWPRSRISGNCDRSWQNSRIFGQVLCRWVQRTRVGLGRICRRVGRCHEALVEVRILDLVEFEKLVDSRGSRVLLGRIHPLWVRCHHGVLEKVTLNYWAAVSMGRATNEIFSRVSWS